jgi:hypothetical protein
MRQPATAGVSRHTNWPPSSGKPSYLLCSKYRPYSHSIINEPSKLLIYRGLATATALFTVTFTVNLI